MVRFSFPNDSASAVHDVRTLLVVASQGLLQPKSTAKLIGAKLSQLVDELTHDIKPGDHGSSGSTLTGLVSPRRLVLGVLSDKISRYNCEAHPEGVYRIVHGAGLAKGKETRSGILLILAKDSHLAPALTAIARAFPLFSRQRGDDDDVEIAIAAVSPRGKTYDVDDQTQLLMESVREAARLVDLPPSDLHPAALAEEAQRLLAGLRSVKVEEITGEALLGAKLGGIWSVGKAAAVQPRILIASYRPQKAKGPHIALVGKGITFDTGGLHLKGRGMMETMKSDMGGAAAVLGAFRVLVSGRHPGRLSLVLAVAENAIGPGAYKPDDILTMHSGKTVEINNTDAEGRLMLADGVSYAARELGAEIILDAATLTGAQGISTGVMHAAVISNDAKLERALIDAGYASGDLVHPLPFAPELFQSEFKSPVADMRNSVKNRNNAQSSCAAQFIYSHLDDTDVRWGHVDLASPAFRSDRGTGFGVALLAETVRRLTPAR